MQRRSGADKARAAIPPSKSPPNTLNPPRPTSIMGTSSGEIKDFAVFFDQRWGFGVQSLFNAIGLRSAQYGLGRILVRLLRG